MVTDSPVTLAPEPISVSSAASVPPALTVLYCATVFLSAFLLFSVQPLMGRLILPYFGGSAAVWSACMLFFQSALLAGYGYADWLASRTARTQGRGHAIFLAAGLLALPIHLNATLGSAYSPAAAIALILALGIGLPYLLLSATSPLLQVWYARAGGKSPARLYALSNTASLLALISYPTVVEPHVSVHGQLLAWSTGFAIFVVLCGATALVASRTQAQTAMEETPVEPQSRPAVGARIQWVLFATIPSALLLATTNHLSQNVASIPFLWVLPLAVYLLTLILCFDYESARRDLIFLWLTPVALLGMGYVALFPAYSMNLKISIPLFTVGLFIVCMTFHSQLVRRKPAGNALTSFYLMVSIGGALGGVLIVLVAPKVLSGIFEMPMLLAASSLFLLMLFYRRHWYLDAFWAAVTITALLFAMLQVKSVTLNARVAERNFYGALRVVDTKLADGTISRSLVHGIIAHGSQHLEKPRSDQATTYYAPGTGVSFALDALRQGPQKVGVIGLGAGTVAAYAKPGDHYTFFELNPQVVQLARSEFTYLDRPGVDVVEGDGRLALGRSAQKFDVIVLDAFSGDSIPTHLLTSEAMQVYLAHLEPQGILAVHISNTILDLEPPVGQLAAASKLYSLAVHTPGDDALSRSEAFWVLMSRDSSRLQNAELQKVSHAPRSKPGQRLWTDDYSSLFQLLKTE